jgi:uncharacterized cupin superfamily protein
MGKGKNMKENIANINKIEWQLDEYEDFSYYRKRLGRLTKGEKLGVSLYKLLPGKKAFPYHYHYANEEAIFVLEGSGSLRMNNEEIAITEGDYIALPTGSEFAHQVINTSVNPLIYFCISTLIYPDVVQYPDSRKIGVTAGVSDGNRANAELKAYFRKQDQVDYFTDES